MPTLTLKKSLKKKIISNYAKIKVPNTSTAFKYAQYKTSNIRIKTKLNTYIKTERCVRLYV